MALYVVLHHVNDPQQPWVNAWKTADLIEVIQTTTEIGQMCVRAKGKGERVFVHRCGWGECSPVICCSGEIERVDPIDKKTSLVRFSNAVSVGSPPPI